MRARPCGHGVLVGPLATYTKTKFCPLGLKSGLWGPNFTWTPGHQVLPSGPEIGSVGSQFHISVLVAESNSRTTQEHLALIQLFAMAAGASPQLRGDDVCCEPHLQHWGALMRYGAHSRMEGALPPPPRSPPLYPCDDCGGAAPTPPLLRRATYPHIHSSKSMGACHGHTPSLCRNERETGASGAVYRYCYCSSLHTILIHH